MKSPIAIVPLVAISRRPLVYQAKAFQVIILSAALFIPSIAIGYLQSFADLTLQFKSALIHEIAISLAIVLAGFITIVAYENYRSSGEPFLRYLTLGFLGFILIYAPHGFLTRMADHDMMTFLIFGPTSRLFAAIYFLLAFFHLQDKPDAAEYRKNPLTWWPHIVLLVSIDIIIGAAATSFDLSISYIRLIEVASLILFIVGIAFALSSRPFAPLMWFHICALVLFVQASFAFLLSSPWSHMWWLAHATSAAGFMLLGYALMHAFLTTRSFKSVYSFTQMHENLVARAQELELSNHKLQIEISERMQAEEEVKTLNKKLEQHSTELQAVNKELEAFSYSVSHDLRTPLRTIDGFSAALLKHYSDRLENEGLQYLQRVRAATAHMNQLIDDLLTLSRISRVDLHVLPTNLSEIAKNIASELTKREPNRQVEFVIAPEIWVVGDARLLRIALDNLFENAWKFTGKHGQALIEFGRILNDGDAPIYFVKDNGVGFDMAYIDRIFGTFQRLHDAREFPGTGIGLSTVQRVIQKHGGRIWAESALNQGARFYFTL